MTGRKKRSILVAVALLGVGAAGATRFRQQAAGPGQAGAAASEAKERPKRPLPTREALDGFWRAAQIAASSTATVTPDRNPQQQQLQEIARSATELDRLTAAVGLTEQQ